ncbi:hypothetical protein ONZ45_g10396 [Pleurotus djamor]|nr:hypothetical protein ONZ45_g10396 [Pleurotus djamor]
MTPDSSSAVSQLFQVPLDAWKISASVSITSLTLVGVLIPTDIPILPSLTRLVVYHAPANSLSLGWTIQLLRNAPYIEYINIEATSSANTIEDTGPVPIPLAKLAYLWIESDSITESKIFDYLTIPPSAFVAATYPSASACPDQIVDLSSFETLVTYMYSGPEVTLDDMAITVYVFTAKLRKSYFKVTAGTHQ